MPGPADAEHDLTPFDHEVFRLLQQDGRRSFVAIAEELGVDETRVRRRVEKLIGDDVFSVTIIADPRLLGLDYMAWIGIEAMSASSVGRLRYRSLRSRATRLSKSPLARWMRSAR